MQLEDCLEFLDLLDIRVKATRVGAVDQEMDHQRREQEGHPSPALQRLRAMAQQRDAELVAIG